MYRRLLICGATIALCFLLGAFTAAVAQQSSSGSPNLTSPTQQCDQYPNFGTRINFEGWAAGTAIDNQYLGSDGVRFGSAATGPVTMAVVDGARIPDGLVLGGVPLFTGDIYASFWVSPTAKGYVTQVAATVGWCNTVGTAVMTALDCDGRVVAQVTNTITGVEWMVVTAPEIHKVIFSGSTDLAGVAVDCFTYDDLHPCQPVIPTLSEWGMIIMFLVMAAGIVWFVMRQRRSMATA